MIQFLQLRGILPNLQSPDLLKELGISRQIVWQKPDIPRYRRKKRLVDVPLDVDSAAEIRDGDGKEDDDLARQDDVVIDPLTQARAFDTTFVSPVDERAKMLAASSSKSAAGPSFLHEAKYSDAEISDEVLGALFVDFLKWFASLDFDNVGISVRRGQPCRRREDEDESAFGPYLPPQDEKWPGNAMLCQDPFIITRNTSGGVIDKSRNKIVQTAKEAVSILYGREQEDEGQDNSNIAGIPLLADLFGTDALESAASKLEKLMASMKPEAKTAVMRDANRAMQTPVSIPGPYRASNTRRSLSPTSRGNGQSRRARGAKRASSTPRSNGEGRPSPSRPTESSQQEAHTQ